MQNLHMSTIYTHIYIYIYTYIWTLGCGVCGRSITHDCTHIVCIYIHKNFMLMWICNCFMIMRYSCCFFLHVFVCASLSLSLSRSLSLSHSLSLSLSPIINKQTISVFAARDRLFVCSVFDVRQFVFDCSVRVPDCWCVRVRLNGCCVFQSAFPL
jgi:hypothetical protein